MSTMPAKRRWLAPEVVQTSAMDCGPASIKCLLEGFHIPVSYGRLREACQTDVDGTSIDVIETVANQLGLTAEQVMLPPDHLFLPEAASLPAMVVVRRSDGATHFVVVWRRIGSFLQIMDPALGRRWTRSTRFAEDLYRHRLTVPASAWREWAGTDDFQRPLERRLRDVGALPADAQALMDRAIREPGWRCVAALDAALRMAAAIVHADGLKPGPSVVKLLDALIDKAMREPPGTPLTIPASYWSVLPAADDPETGEQLQLHGAVLLRIKGRRPQAAADAENLSPELAAALSEPQPRPGRLLWGMLKADGLLTPLALLGALVISVGAVLMETLLFRGLFDIAWELNLANQRLAAMLGLMALVALLLCMEFPIALESLRMGRHLEARLRMALLGKLPQLGDRYFQSRPISDMADRGHSLYLTRLVPDLGVQLIQGVLELFFTLTAIAIIDAPSIPLAVAIATLALVIPLLMQPAINERDLRMRSHAGALQGFYLDALIGLVPIRTHGAERAVRREHEGLLVEWARSGRSLIRLSLAGDGLQAFACVGLACWLLLEHVGRSGITGAVLLLVYWTLKLPALGRRLNLLARQYPAQRNVLLRLLEPLAAPDESPQDQAPPSDTGRRDGVAVAIEAGSVLAAGHIILQDIDLHIAPGEHVAVVGPSGAGKSSLIGLLLGWHRLASGRLLIDGEVLSGAGLEALRRQTAWVDPAIQIWNRPFLDNLAFSSPGSAQATVGRVLELADLHGVLKKLPQGLQTPLGEGGALVSGGEGQRIRLGRAMMQDRPRLALLDEPFRGLDRQQRRTLLEHSRQCWADATLICITHDVAETLSFGRVLVVEDGRIVEDGSPSALMAGPSRYRRLLEADDSLRSELWQSDLWRRIQLRDGRVYSPQPVAGD